MNNVADLILGQIKSINNVYGVSFDEGYKLGYEKGRQDAEKELKKEIKDEG